MRSWFTAAPLALVFGLNFQGCYRQQRVASPPTASPVMAQDIHGADENGTQFKLSDHRGKVVVLTFWADW